MKGMDLKMRKYPNFEEYILVDNLTPGKIMYKRGSDADTMVNHEDFRRWQDFFNNIYVPPENKDVLLLHVCSWSKPYDFSYIIKPIKDVADKFPSVHRAIMSSAGIIPYEYQMNLPFCSYDYNPLLDTLAEQRKAANTLFLDNMEACLYNYLSSHKNHYKYVLLYYPPVTSKWVLMVKRVCDSLNVKIFISPNIDTFLKYMDKSYQNKEEIFIEPELLEHLELMLQKIAKKVSTTECF